MTVRLEWDGKPERVERVHLPSRPSRPSTSPERLVSEIREHWFGGDDPQTAERNQLIWGDNKLVMSSLLAEYAGKVKLVYIDPPFDTGTDFSHRIAIGDAIRHEATVDP